MMNQPCSEAGGLGLGCSSSEITKGKEKNVEMAAPGKALELCSE